MSPTDIPLEGRIIYSQILACTSTIDSAFRESNPITGPSYISNPITLKDIYSYIITL